MNIPGFHISNIWFMVKMDCENFAMSAVKSKERITKLLMYMGFCEHVMLRILILLR